jgi:hypothetical protein
VSRDAWKFPSVTCKQDKLCFELHYNVYVDGNSPKCYQGDSYWQILEKRQFEKNAEAVAEPVRKKTVGAAVLEHSDIAPQACAAASYGVREWLQNWRRTVIHLIQTPQSTVHNRLMRLPRMSQDQAKGKMTLMIPQFTVRIRIWIGRNSGHQ